MLLFSGRTGVTLVIILMILSLTPGCIEIGKETGTPVPETSPFEPPSEGQPPVTPQEYVTPIPTPVPPFVGSAVPADPLPPVSTSRPPQATSLPDTSGLARPNEMATATFYAGSFPLMYNNVAFLVTVNEAPFVIEFWTDAYSYNPHESLLVITVRDPATGEIILEDGFNGFYSSDYYKRMIIRDSGRFHVNIYGMRTAVGIKMRGGVPESAAEPYGIQDLPLVSSEREYPEEEVG